MWCAFKCIADGAVALRQAPWCVGHWRLPLARGPFKLGRCAATEHRPSQRDLAVCQCPELSRPRRGAPLLLAERRRGLRPGGGGPQTSESAA